MSSNHLIPHYYYGTSEGRGYLEHITSCTHVAQAIGNTVTSNKVPITGSTNHGRQTLGILQLGFQTSTWEFGKIQSGFVQSLNRFNDTFIQVSKNIYDELDKIKDNPRNPFWLQSRELYDRALLNYCKGFCEEAARDLIKAIEINKTDYMSWFLLGKTHLFGVGEFSCAIDLDAAICAFANAAKYIKPDIAKHDKLRQTAAEMLFHLGLSRQTKAKYLAFKQGTKEDTDLITETRLAYNQSWAYDKEMLESLYNSARCDVILGNEKMALNKLQTVVQRDPKYAEKVMDDPDFVPLYDDIINMIGTMKKKVTSELLRLKRELEPQYKLLPVKLVAILNEIPNKELLEASSCADAPECILRIRNEVFDFYEEVNAFRDCSGLTSIAIPEGVTSIREGAFHGCSSLTSATIPKGVTRIEHNAFKGCCSLTSVVISQGVISIGKNAFSNCSTLTSIAIPQGVTHIGDYAFFDCSSLISIDIPQSVADIGKGAFASCPSLLSVVIPHGVTRIERDTFKGCCSLTSITIPKSILKIGASAFHGCLSLLSVVIPKGITHIKRDTFKGCCSLTFIEIPESVTNIGTKAFHGCSTLTSLVIPQRVTSIKDGVFFGCASLTSLVIPEGVTEIGKNAFNYCSSLTSVAIPQSVTSIGEYAFLGCENLPDEFRKELGKK